MNLVHDSIDIDTLVLEDTRYNHIHEPLDYDLLIEISILFTLILLIVFFFLIKERKLKAKIQDMADNLEVRVKEELEKNMKKDKQMLNQSRLAQMGEMISMIAHQWRQPLGAITATTIDIKLKQELGIFSLKDEKSKEEYQQYIYNSLSKIEEYTQSLTTTIDDFRNFYKPDKVLKLVSIDGPILKALDIVRSGLVVNNIQIIEEYNSFNKIHILDSEIMQVILNIIKNAEDSLMGSQVKSPYIRIVTEDMKNGVLLEIHDNGEGIDADIIEHIFDPYFSTKDEKNGSGLGLYMSQIIVQEHHYGEIGLRNTEEGICVRIKIQEDLRQNRGER